MINNKVYSIPAEDFLALDPVLMIDPSLNTAVRFSTFSRIEPYRTAVDPLQRQAHMPGINEYMMMQGMMT